MKTWNCMTGFAFLCAMLMLPPSHAQNYRAPRRG